MLVVTIFMVGYNHKNIINSWSLLSKYTKLVIPWAHFQSTTLDNHNPSPLVKLISDCNLQVHRANLSSP